jgi:asparagine synthase (glutamine-hydrolysing)
MSIQFGRWNFNEQPLDRKYFEKVSALSAKYGHDREAACFRRTIAMQYEHFHITEESCHEIQPLEGPAGVMLTWDGRLDNRDELIPQVGLDSQSSPSDAEVILAAYERWSKDCLPKLLGDWALALWNPAEQSLLLAKDFAGSRPLFYSLESTRVTWSTVLDPLVLLAEVSFPICEEFVAGYLSTYPATHLTPYLGINAVPPGTYVEIKRKHASTYLFWGFDSARTIRYRADGEYEEHFRSVFAEAVRRRLRSSAPVLAELSGGMDSTSIVCMADIIMGEGNGPAPRLDTISYYDDNEPNWNELPYVSLVERKRRRKGYHVDVGGFAGAFEVPEGTHFAPIPGCDKLELDRCKSLGDCLEASQCRVLLSGVGGDEFLGGVPNPTPELQDQFVLFEWRRFAERLLLWSLERRCPWTRLCFDTLEEFLPRGIRELYTDAPVAPWFSDSLVARHRNTCWASVGRVRLIGPLPGWQSCINTLDRLRRQLHCSQLGTVYDNQVTYPYFDRDLLTFLFAVPREQLCRPGQRRSLMRRALADLVPPEIFARKRKAFVARQPLKLLACAYPRIEQLLQAPLTVSYGWVRRDAVLDALRAATIGKVSRLVPLLRLLQLELWLQTLVKRGVLAAPASRPDVTLPMCATARS